ncbi:MAG: hypothetical protein QXT57_04085 [Thermosphaera sp.]
MPDSCLVIVGDGDFTSGLRSLVDEHQRVGEPTVVCLYDVGNLELARNCSFVRVDEDFRVILMEEPSASESTLVSIRVYLFPRNVPPRFKGMLSVGGPDELRRFTKWFIFSGAGLWIFASRNLARYWDS